MSIEPKISSSVAPIMGDVKVTLKEDQTKRATVTANRPGGGKIAVTIHYSTNVSNDQISSDLEKQMSKLVHLFKSSPNVDMHLHFDDKGNVTKGRSQYIEHLDGKIKELSNERFKEGLPLDKLAKINDEIEKLSKMKDELASTKKVSTNVFMKCVGREVRADHNKQLEFKEGAQFKEVKDYKREEDIRGVKPEKFTRFARDEGTMTGKLLSKEQIGVRIFTYEEREASQRTANEFGAIQHIVNTLDLEKINPENLTSKQKEIAIKNLTTLITLLKSDDYLAMKLAMGKGMPVSIVADDIKAIQQKIDQLTASVKEDTAKVEKSKKPQVEKRPSDAQLVSPKPAKIQRSETKKNLNRA